MQLKRIFLDLDDVLNDCTMSALQHVDCPVEPFEFKKFNPEWGFNISKAANALHPGASTLDTLCGIEYPFTPQNFWDQMDRSFWANLPKSQEFDLLLELSEKTVNKDSIFILTTPISDPDCAAGKVEWIQRCCPSWLHDQYIICKHKEVCAQPGALLIDDSDKNIEQFKDAGGEIIIMPRPWNSLHGIHGTLQWLLLAFASKENEI
jgi:hypothetical protein